MPNLLAHLSDRATERAEARRWWILAVLCFSLLVLVLDTSILNLAIPAIVDELDASTSELQWMLDGYTLVLAGLVLTAGCLGDRYGRRPALQVGFVIFGLGSLLAALAGSPLQLIATRSLMGVGSALIMPATLSIIANVFPPAERPRAIGMWAATAGVAGVLGPLGGGFLLEHFYWGSVFLVNLPVVGIGLIAGVVLIPDSKDPHPARLDLVGALLSAVGLAALVFGVIEGPERGWTAAPTLAGFAVGGVGLAGFFWWERHVEHPMLDLSFFRNRRFSAGSGVIALTFFTMYGALLMLTQYLQFALGYSPLATGVRLLPIAVAMLVVSPLSARIAERVGTKLTVAAGQTFIAGGLLSVLALDDASPYTAIWWRLALFAVGIGLTMAPATEAVMGSLPLTKAGVGSAVNDTTRMVGGAIGVAVVGSVYSSTYGSRLTDTLAGGPVPAGALGAAKESVGAAVAAADRLTGTAGDTLYRAALESFVDGFHAGFGVAAGAAALAVLAVLAWLPAHASRRTDDTPDHTAAEPVPALAGGPVSAVDSRGTDL